MIVIVGCNTINRHNYDIEIDGSNSISAYTFDKYVSIIVDDVLPNLTRNDCISIKFVDECSLTKSERVFTVDLAKKDFTNKDDGLNLAEDSIRIRLKRFIKDTVCVEVKNVLYEKRRERTNCAGYTNIIDALSQSASLINNKKNFVSNLDQLANEAVGQDNYKYDNIILIFSDMVNENREQTMNFTEFGNSTQKQINKKLEEIQKESKIPDLRKVKIIVYGSTSTIKSGHLADNQVENIRLFWRKYFKEAGVDLIAYGYDTEKEIKDYMINQNY